MIRVFLLLLGTLMSAAPSSPVVVIEEEMKQVVAPGATVRKLAGDLKFTEGPVWVRDGGYLVFSDIPASILYRWSESDGLTVFRQPSDNANGNTLTRAGRIITCEHGSRVVTITDPSRPAEKHTLVDRFEGKRFNSPNDVVEKSDGTLWFTDPPYGLPKGTPKELDDHYVFRLDPKTGAIAIVAKGFDMPNGLCFSPDEKTLYVADSGKPRNIRAFAVNSDNTLAGGEVFCTIDVGGPDGIRCDRDGRVFSSSGDGAQVFDLTGKRIGRILTPEAGANLCFGGPDNRTLFITARTGLYAIDLLVHGDR